MPFRKSCLTFRGSRYRSCEGFGVPAAEAFGVATFLFVFISKRSRQKRYSHFESAPCHIAGAAKVVAALERELGIPMEGSTADGRFALEFTECVGQCQATPVITINGKPYFDVTPANVADILAEYK